jgi:glycine oxidase
MSGSRNGADLLVVGGGVVGMAVAREACALGMEVIVLERRRSCREASWAAAGMLSPLGEALEPGPFLRFGLESLAAWPRFAAELEEETGADLALRRTGKIRIATTSREEERLRARLWWAENREVPASWLQGEAVQGLEPALAGPIRSGLLLEDDYVVDNRVLGEALPASVQARGGTVQEGVEVRELLVEKDAVQGVRTSEGEEVRAGAVVVAAGAWSGLLGGLEYPFPVRPVAGQMLALRPRELPSRRVLESESVYLVPREDGRVLVGSTVEEVGFRTGVTADGIRGLLGAAVDLVPTLADALIAELWSGLRPATPDGMPLLGPHPAVGGLHFATGHFRNGILLTPATARGMASLLGGRGESPFPPEFSPDRFLPSERQLPIPDREGEP